MTVFYTEPSSQFAGWIYIQDDPAKAIIQTTRASSQPPSFSYVHINLFCDCSRSTTSNHGGIAVAYRPWLPGISSTDVITAAWPVDPLYNTTVGELLAISECTAIATEQICQFAQLCLPIVQPVVVRIFSDSQDGLAHLQGMVALRHDINLLTRPVLDHIALQSAALHHLDANVHLELHWIPGHGHEVQPHVMADTYSRFARICQTGYSTVTRNHWQLPEEPSVLSTCASSWLTQLLKQPFT
jgi:hypothetical protein